MNDILITIIAAVIPALLTGLVTLYVTRNSQLNKNTKKINALKKQIYTNHENLSKIIGILPDDKTLTGQHKDLQNIIENEIRIIEMHHNEREKQIQSFTSEQHDMAQSISQFKLFMDSWFQLNSELNEAKEHIHTLEKELSYQKELNTELKKYKSTAKADINISDENDDIER